MQREEKTIPLSLFSLASLTQVAKKNLVQLHILAMIVPFFIIIAIIITTIIIIICFHKGTNVGSKQPSRKSPQITGH